MRRLRYGCVGVAWLAAVLFTTHPILVESVPAALATYLVGFSPLLREYAGWRESARLSEDLFRGLRAALAGAPSDAVLHVHGLPVAFRDDHLPAAHARSVSFPADYTIAAWYGLRHPGSRLQVIVHDAATLPWRVGALDVVARRDGPRDVHVTIAPRGG